MPMIVVSTSVNSRNQCTLETFEGAQVEHAQGALRLALVLRYFRIRPAMQVPAQEHILHFSGQAGERRGHPHGLLLAHRPFARRAVVGAQIVKITLAVYRAQFLSQPPPKRADGDLTKPTCKFSDRFPPEPGQAAMDF